MPFNSWCENCAVFCAHCLRSTASYRALRMVRNDLVPQAHRKNHPTVKHRPSAARMFSRPGATTS